MNIPDSRGTTISQESISTCGTNNSAFFRVEIEPYEMKYSMSDVSVSGLVSSLTRSGSNEGITNEVGNKIDTLFKVNAPDTTNDVRTTLTSSLSNSKLNFARPFQRPNPSTSSDDELIYATPFNAETIFRHQSNAVSPHGGDPNENTINQANPVESSNSDGTSQQLGKEVVCAKSSIADKIQELELELHTKEEGEQSRFNKQMTRACEDEEQIDAMDASIEMQFIKLNQSSTSTEKQHQQLQNTQSQITTSNSTRTSCLTSETVICEEASTTDQSTFEILLDGIDGILTKFRSQNEHVAEQLNVIQSSIGSFCSKQLFFIPSTCSGCDDAPFENVSRVQKSSNISSCINEETVEVEQWAKEMNIKVSELHDIIKYRSVAALNSAKSCGASAIDCRSNSKSKPIYESLMDNNSLIESKQMIEKQILLSDYSLHSGEISSETSNHWDSTSASTLEEETVSNRATGRETEQSIICQSGIATDVEATKQFIEEVDQYAAQLGIDRAEFLSKIASMIKEHNAEELHINKIRSRNGMQDILEIFTTSCNPSNLSTSGKSYKQNPHSFKVVEENVTKTLICNDDVDSASEFERVRILKASNSKSDLPTNKNDNVNEVFIINPEENGKDVNKDNGGMLESSMRSRGKDSITTKPSRKSPSSYCVIHRRVGIGRSMFKNGNKQSNKFVQKGQVRLMK